MIKQNDILTTILHTVVCSKHRDDLWALIGEIAADVTNFVQRQNTTATVARVQTQDIVSEPAAHVTAPAQKSQPVIERDPDDTSPLWLSRSFNWAEFHLYQYSAPEPTSAADSKCGQVCVKTELWLVGRRTYKLATVDAEFATVDDAHDFLDPRVELAKQNNVYPLEFIDKELAGSDGNADNEPKESVKYPVPAKLARFVDVYKQHDGDTEKVMRDMGFTSKQNVYSYKNKAKVWGLL